MQVLVWSKICCSFSYDGPSNDKPRTVVTISLHDRTASWAHNYCRAAPAVQFLALFLCPGEALCPLRPDADEKGLLQGAQLKAASPSGIAEELVFLSLRGLSTSTSAATTTAGILRSQTGVSLCTWYRQMSISHGMGMSGSWSSSPALFTPRRTSRRK